MTMRSFALSLDVSPAVLSVAVANKLLLFRWVDGGFSEWKEFLLPHTSTLHVPASLPPLPHPPTFPPTYCTNSLAAVLCRL